MSALVVFCMFATGTMQPYFAKSSDIPVSRINNNPKTGKSDLEQQMEYRVFSSQRDYYSDNIPPDHFKIIKTRAGSEEDSRIRHMGGLAKRVQTDSISSKDALLQFANQLAESKLEGWQSLDPFVMHLLQSMANTSLVGNSTMNVVDLIGSLMVKYLDYNYKH